MMSFKIYVKFNMRIIYIYLLGVVIWVVILVILLIFKCKILNFKKFSIIDIYKDR